MNKQVTLTEAEAKVVMQCLDLAVKTGGLNAAASILPIATAIESQLVAAQSPAPAVPLVTPEQSVGGNP
jgi:hypothetical protein